jgi:hypothetical protein
MVGGGWALVAVERGGGAGWQAREASVCQRKLATRSHPAPLPLSRPPPVRPSRARRRCLSTCGAASAAACTTPPTSARSVRCWRPTASRSQRSRPAARCRCVCGGRGAAGNQGSSVGRREPCSLGLLPAPRSSSSSPWPHLPPTPPDRGRHRQLRHHLRLPDRARRRGAQEHGPPAVRRPRVRAAGALRPVRGRRGRGRARPAGRRLPREQPATSLFPLPHPAHCPPRPAPCPTPLPPATTAPSSRTTATWRPPTARSPSSPARVRARARAPARPAGSLRAPARRRGASCAAHAPPCSGPSLLHPPHPPPPPPPPTPTPIPPPPPTAPPRSVQALRRVHGPGRGGAVRR